MDHSTDKQTSATGGRPTGGRQRLPWNNLHVAALVGKRDAEGGRILQPRDVMLLGFLDLAHPELEAVVSREEIMAWLECAQDTPREILCRLRRLRLIEYEPLGGGEARVASRLADQPALPLSESLTESRNQQVIPGRVSTESPSDSRNRQVIPGAPPPHPHPGVGASGMYTTQHDTAHARAHEATESGRVGGQAAIPEAVSIGHARSLRRELIGAARLSEKEYPKFIRVRELGGTDADLDDALDEFRLRIEQKRAFLSSGSFGLVLDLALDAVSAREEIRHADQRTASDGRDRRRGSPPADRGAVPPRRGLAPPAPRRGPDPERLARNREQIHQWQLDAEGNQRRNGSASRG